MWAPATRGRMAEIEKKTKRYPTELTDEEWARIEPFLPGAAKSGRPSRTDLREVLNGIRYLARSGGGWRMLPKDFPPWPTVFVSEPGAQRAPRAVSSIASRSRLPKRKREVMTQARRSSDASATSPLIPMDAC